MSSRIYITPGYNDVFDGENGSLIGLISNIPSSVIIRLLSLINAQLNLDAQDFKTQINILSLFIRRQSNELKNSILDKIKDFFEKGRGDGVQLFAKHFVLEFIHHEIVNYRAFELTELTPEQELNIFKAYLHFVEQKNNIYTQVYNENDLAEGDFFQTHTWPTIIDQFEINRRINPIEEMVKGLSVLNYFYRTEEYKNQIINFLKFHESVTPMHYILMMLEVTKIGWTEQKGFYGCIIRGNSNGYKQLFNNYSIDIDSYKKEYSNGKKYFEGFKNKPIYKVGEEYVVIDWSFFYNKMYTGLIYDLYENAGFKSEFSNYLEFKKYISENVIEKDLFRKLIRRILNDKHAVLVFDSDERGYPDVYCRKGKAVMLMEIKDAYFPAKTINSLSFQVIKETIDNKFNNNKKGTGQIVKQINILKTNLFEKRSYTELNIKPRNLVIYPVIFYTDYHFSLPGLNNYLKQEFETKLINNATYFKTIKPLTFINLSFLIQYVSSIEKIGFYDLIDFYHKKIIAAHKKFKKERSMENFFAIQSDFEYVVLNGYKSAFKRDENYIKIIVDILNLIDKE